MNLRTVIRFAVVSEGAPGGRPPPMRPAPSAPAPWQRAIRPGDHLVAAMRVRGSLTLAWVTVAGATAGSTHVRVARQTGEAPAVVVERMPRAAAVFPVSGAGFEAARRAGWPSALAAVHALVGVVAGGAA